VYLLSTLLGLSLAAGQDLGPARDRTGDGAVLVEWSAEPAEPYVGQTVELLLRCGVERRVFDEQLVQPFRTPLDVPVQVILPGLAEVTGVRLHPYEPAGETTLVLDSAPVAARGLGEVARGGSSYVMVELTRTLTVTREGDVVLPAPRVRFATATAFREDLLLGRVAVDRDDAVVLGAPLTLAVRALPEEGRPLGFTGALGRFEVWATADRRRLEVGEGLVLTVDLEGPGQPGQGLAGWPTLVPGFHVRGRSDDGPRRVVLDLVPSGAEVDEVPALGFAYFDPATAAFGRSETEPIPLEVRRPAPEPGHGAPPGVRPDGGEPEEGGPWSGRRVYLALSAAVVLLALVAARARAGARGGSRGAGDGDAPPEGGGR